jgi:hypothetical protein
LAVEGTFQRGVELLHLRLGGEDALYLRLVGSVIIEMNRRGVTCQDTPKRSFTRPQTARAFSKPYGLVYAWMRPCQGIRCG